MIKKYICQAVMALPQWMLVKKIGVLSGYNLYAQRTWLKHLSNWWAK